VILISKIHITVKMYVFLTVFRKILALYSENQTKPIKWLCEQHAETWTLRTWYSGRSQLTTSIWAVNSFISLVPATKPSHVLRCMVSASPPLKILPTWSFLENLYERLAFRVHTDNTILNFYPYINTATIRRFLTWSNIGLRLFRVGFLYSVRLLVFETFVTPV
jgi:hypothetical protein